jgi:hypothetical protein
MSKSACKATVRRLWDEAFNQGNLALMDEICDARHVTHDRALPELPTGPDGLKRVLDTYREVLAGAPVQLEALFGQESKVVAHWSAELPALAPAQPRTLSGMSVYRFEGDKIIETWSQCGALSLTTHSAAPPAQV